MKFLVRVISEHSLKAISVMFESGTFGSCLVQKLKSKGVGEGDESWLPAPPRPKSYAPVYINHLGDKVIYKWPYYILKPKFTNSTVFISDFLIKIHNSIVKY